MKIKKNLKRFFTLSRGNEGFTLVELIVVIAILAILGGVAVPAYSGYISKTQQTNDISLANEVRNAMLLAMYSNELTEGDYVVLNYEGNATFGNYNGENGETVNAAMKAAFGDNWTTACALSYGEWENSVDPSMIEYVDKSCFDEESLDDLLTSVQYVTDNLNGVLASGKVTIDEDSELAKYLTNAGIDYTTDTQAASNATVLYVGNSYANAEISDVQFLACWMEVSFNAIFTADPIAAQAGNFAATLALAEYIDPKAGTEYAKELNSATGTAIITTMNSVLGKMAGEHMALVQQYWGNGVDYTDPENPVIDTTSQAYADAMAFKSYMQGMSSATGNLMGSTDIGASDYFTNGTVLGYVTDFINMGEIMNTLGASNSFVFVYNGNGVSCNILDYQEN